MSVSVEQRAAELRAEIAKQPQPRRSRYQVRLNAALRSTDTDRRDAEMAELDRLLRRDDELSGLRTR